MKNRLALIFTVIFAFFLSTFSTVSRAQEQTSYTDAEGAYTIRYPANWELQKMGGAIIAMSPQDSATDTFRESVNFVHESLTATMTSQQYAVASVPVLQQQLRDFLLLEQGVANLAGLSVNYLVYSHNMMGHDLRVLAYFVVRGGRGYVITCTASNADFARYRPDFVRVANTIRFR